MGLAGWGLAGWGLAGRRAVAARRRRGAVGPPKRRLVFPTQQTWPKQPNSALGDLGTGPEGEPASRFIPAHASRGMNSASSTASRDQMPVGVRICCARKTIGLEPASWFPENDKRPLWGVRGVAASRIRSRSTQRRPRRPRQGGSLSRTTLDRAHFWAADRKEPVAHPRSASFVVVRERPGRRAGPRATAEPKASPRMPREPLPATDIDGAYAGGYSQCVPTSAAAGIAIPRERPGTIPV
jgi:hypothetical protein